MALACCAWLVAPTAARATTHTFAFTNSEQSFTVPAGVTSLYVVAVGAPGGHGAGSSGGTGGRGARVAADVSVMPGEVLYVEVGGVGGDSTQGTSGSAGFNGGGPGAASVIGNGGGGGGGASDVRTVSVFTNVTTSLESRLIAAGGGGGGGGESNVAGGNGGGAGQSGSPTPSSCVLGSPCGGGAGTANSGGLGGASYSGCSGDGSNGILGAGGQGGGGNNVSCTDGGGGGGGLYGGGGGGGGAEPQEAGGGGGGSSGFGTGTSNMSVAADTTGTPFITITYAPTLTVAKGGGGKGTVTSSPAGISCGTVCQHQFQAGTAVTLTAKPAIGSRFAGWSGACHGTGACHVTINSSVSVRATFTAIPPPNTTITDQHVSRTKRRGTFDFRGSGGTGALHFQCRLDAGPWKPCTSPQTYRRLHRGSHTFRVRAVDAIGRLDPTPDTRTFTI